jgi:hypothetical protein
MLSATATALGKPSDGGRKECPSDGAARNQKIYHSSVNLTDQGGATRRGVI